MAVQRLQRQPAIAHTASAAKPLSRYKLTFAAPALAPAVDPASMQEERAWDFGRIPVASPKQMDQPAHASTPAAFPVPVPMPLQLHIEEANDPLEVEADRAVDHVLSD